MTVTPASSTELLDLPVDLLGTHPKNPRFDVGDVTELADSIAQQGLLEPLIVAPAEPPNEHYVLIAGHRRKAAAEKAGLPTVPCIVRRDLDTAARQLEAMRWAAVETMPIDTSRSDVRRLHAADGARQLLAKAGVHATLALAAATAYPAVRDWIGDEARDGCDWTRVTS